MASEDTETLIALVSSLLDGGPHDQGAILDALMEAEGDPEKAAHLLNTGITSERGASSSQIRKKGKGTSLVGWLNNARRDQNASSSAKHLKRVEKRRRSTSPESILRHSTAGATSAAKKPRSVRSSTQSPTKPPSMTNEQFKAIFHPQSSKDTKMNGPTKYPPLTLSTPEQVAAHVPCTMHASVLPPELACRSAHIFVITVNR